MITLGPWTFTLEDARRTVEVLHEVVEHAAWQRPRGVFDTTRDGVHHIQEAHAEPVEQRLATAWQLITGVRATLENERLLPSRATGLVEGLFTSSGGVPKSATATAEITFRGVVGDQQATRRHHGRPWQALCLWSTDVVDAMAAEGHPIFPGAAGENVSIRGIDWDLVRPGVRLGLGEVMCEVSAYAIPCRKNAQWFKAGRFNTMHHSYGPVSRVYATVLIPGAITVGATATLEPDNPEQFATPRGYPAHTIDQRG